jgi:hypothetical protein
VPPATAQIGVSEPEVADVVHALQPHALMLTTTNPSSPTMAEVLDRVLDKGIVIDAVSRVSVAGTELVTVRAHVVVTSIDTHLKYFAEGAGKPKPQATRVVDVPAFLPD